MAISIRDPYTSPFTSRCKFARCLLLVRCLCSETVAIGFLISVEPNFVERTALGSLKRRRSYSEVSKRRHNFGTKRFKEKSLFIFHARIALKSLILLFVRLIARGARIQGRSHRSGWSGFNPTTFLASMITLESNLQAVTVPQYRRAYRDLRQARGCGY